LTALTLFLPESSQQKLLKSALKMEKAQSVPGLMLPAKSGSGQSTFRFQIGNYGSIAMTDIAQLLGKDADNLLQHRCMTIPSDQLYLPGHDYVDRVMVDNNRPPAVLRNMQTLYNTGDWPGQGICRFYRWTRGGALRWRIVCG
jgi:class I fructose-bisphosphate aldolase